MIKLTQIENEAIFTRDFNPLVENNEICFSTSADIAVIYGPNGTGKTSLIKVLSDEKGTKVEFEYNGQTYTSGKEVFHIINDQNNRNIIKGETKDFFLGDDIRREFTLKESIEAERSRIIHAINDLLKSHGITAANSSLIGLISDPGIAVIVKDMANKQSPGKNTSSESLIEKLKTISIIEIAGYDEAKLKYIQEDIASKDSIIGKIEAITSISLTSNPRIRQIEENTEAISILNRFHKDQCIVCDTIGIDWETLLDSKTKNRTTVIEALNDKVKSIIEKIINLVSLSDPFQVKIRLLDAISEGNNANIISLVDEIGAYKVLYSQIVLNDLAELISGSDLASQMFEYKALIDEKPEITEEDMLYIREIISNSMSQRITLERDKNKNLKILLSDKEFLGKTRDELPLSSGEQNFLSLTFEFMKAKNSECPIVIIDDPISSFDSIYKNKVVYAIVKMLQNKKRIVLTHNTDLIRLLESQYENCYKLYLLSNTEGGKNGFIALKPNEQKMIISLKKLLSTFRFDIFQYILDVELFLISVVPFMRGYANIINKENEYEKLTQLMHGYKDEKVDIAKIYETLFENNGGVLPKSYEVSVSDILLKTVDDGIHILDTEQYPLLDKTLRHSFSYLYLRLMVERALVAKFRLNTNKYKQLGDIIRQAYKNENDKDQIRKRIQLTSKKTLINEFNHFEGNLSIFQPAIDITDAALRKEKDDIEEFVKNL